MPSTIEVDSIKQNLMKAFPAITNVHHLHIWRLNQSSVIATVHIKFVSSKAYSKISPSINDFFNNEGIMLSTVQPEFENWENSSLNGSAECILRCRTGECKSRMCCKEEENEYTENRTNAEQSIEQKEEQVPLASCSEDKTSRLK